MANTKKIWVANNFHVDCSGLRATSGKRQALKATSSKLQATSGKPQAASRKRQAS